MDTPRPYKFYPKPLSISPITAVTDHPALDAQLRASDFMLARPAGAELLTKYSTQKGLVFGIEEDDDIVLLLQYAATYGCTWLGYNAEGLAHAELLARLKRVYTEFRDESPLDFEFVPTYYNLQKHYLDYLPYCERVGVQLQKAAIADVPALAAEVVAMLKAAKSTVKVDIQLGALPPNTKEQLLAAMRGIATLNISGVILYCGNASNYPLAFSVLDAVR